MNNSLTLLQALCGLLYFASLDVGESLVDFVFDLQLILMLILVALWLKNNFLVDLCLVQLASNLFMAHYGVDGGRVDENGRCFIFGLWHRVWICVRVWVALVQTRWIPLLYWSQPRVVITLIWYFIDIKNIRSVHARVMSCRIVTKLCFRNRRYRI